MSKIKDSLMNKNGLTSMNLAKEFLKFQVGDKIPTVSDLCDSLDVARGTVQNAMKLLQSFEAIEIEARGHLGSFLVRKNSRILLEFANITFLIGAMPLPYSKQYEGFATGLIKAAQNEYELSVSLAYMRGSKKRIAMVSQSRYDFAIVSKMSALEYMAQYGGITIALDFGPKSFLSNHIILFHQPHKRVIEDGMRVGIDRDSIDHMRLTESICKGKKVELVEVEYSRISKMIVDGYIDAGVWNEDVIKDQQLDINYAVLDTQNDDTTAVLVIRQERSELYYLLKEMIDIAVVLQVQNLVKANQMSPSY